ncbi:hypothetical protein B0H13DRAFT_2335337 [Mycena leptocephala]|nr:hypothetical protein B0H13DRAFT_2335337 [Mycena leptocephala]
MPSSSPPSIQLANVAIGSLLYGVYLNLFFTSLYLLFKRPKVAHPHRSMMFIMGCTLFVAVTANWISMIVIGFNGFIFFKGGAAANEYFSNTRLGLQIALLATGIVSMIVNDSMMIFRLWVVWSHNKVVVALPILSWIGLVVSATLAAFNSWGTVIVASDVGFLPMFILILLTDLAQHFLAMVVESSALYTAWTVFFTVTQQANSVAEYFAFGVFPAIAGIANSLLQDVMVPLLAINSPDGSLVRAVPVHA